MPPSKTRRRAPARANPTGRLGSLVELDQRVLDVVGLALIGLAVLLGFIVYFGGEGGAVGVALGDAFRWVAGQLAYVAPPALALAGAVLIARPFATVPAHLGAGVALALLGGCLMLATRTFGLGPGEPPRTEAFDWEFVRAHGGAVGEVLYWATTSLFQRAGAHILGPLLVIAGAVLASGLSIAEIVASLGRLARRGAGASFETARTVRRGTPGWDLEEPEGDEIAITRHDETELLPTEAIDDESLAEALDAAERAQAESEAPTDPADPGSPVPQHGQADPSAATEGEATDEVDEPAQDGSDAAVTPMGAARTGGITISEERSYDLPARSSLERGRGEAGPDRSDREATARALLEALLHFGVEAKLSGVVSGPHVSRFELQLAPGTKVGKVAQLKDDLAYALASTDIRILAPIPGKKAVGVEVPNTKRRMVRLGDVWSNRPQGASPLVAWLGRDVSGQAIHADLATMPHLLVAGTTGSGKSGCVNAMLCSILMAASPNEVRLVLVDPKRVELNHYESLPHLLTPVVTNPRLAATVLANLIAEMESRYQTMGEARARNLAELNRLRKREGEPPLPHVLCVIDELADLMMVAPAEVEDSIIRLAQKSRAVGIHLVLATQRPSTDVITGTIKVNIPSRIAFAVASQVDSRVILDGSGAESLLGQGDMLFRPVGTSRMSRIQGAFVGEEEVSRIAGHWASQGEPEYDPGLVEAPPESSEHEGWEGELSPDSDELLEEAARFVVEADTASVSMIQRRFRVGYTRAGRLIDMLERRGVISGYEGSKPRQVLVSQADLPRMLGGEPHGGEGDAHRPVGPAGEGAAQSDDEQARSGITQA